MTEIYSDSDPNHLKPREYDPLHAVWHHIEGTEVGAKLPEQLHRALKIREEINSLLKGKNFH